MKNKLAREWMAWSGLLVLALSLFTWLILKISPGTSPQLGDIGGFLEGTIGVAVAFSGAYIAIKLASLANETLLFERRRETASFISNQTQEALQLYSQLGISLGRIITDSSQIDLDSIFGKKLLEKDDRTGNVIVNKSAISELLQNKSDHQFSEFNSFNCDYQSLLSSFDHCAEILENIQCHFLAKYLWTSSTSKGGIGMLEDPSSLASAYRIYAKHGRRKDLSKSTPLAEAMTCTLVTLGDIPFDEVLFRIVYASWLVNGLFSDKVFHNRSLELYKKTIQSIPTSSQCKKTLAEYFQTLLSGTSGVTILEIEDTLRPHFPPEEEHVFVPDLTKAVYDLLVSDQLSTKITVDI